MQISPFSFGRKLFLSVTLLFLTFVAIFVIFQYQREKEFKVELLNSKLQDCNDWIHRDLTEHKEKGTECSHLPIEHFGLKELRVTVIDFEGNVIYDSSEANNMQLANHLYRPEVEQAINNGYGHDVRRVSESTGITYFYSATRYNDYIIRTALPYDTELKESLRIDLEYIGLAILVALALIFIFYKATNRLGISVNNLREFAIHIDRNEPYDYNNILATFSNDELGEISQHIIQIYQRLHETKEALYIEREKLIAHLQTSREGLGVFTRDKKEILVNSLFSQYSNIISDYNLETTESIFNIPEFESITQFINKIQSRPTGKEEKRMSRSITKDGRNFTIECIIFQDFSFEISINDVTQEEEQGQLKRQLTQNIAHELKTPVSSIQAYLETIVTNENISPEKASVFLQRCYEQSNRLSRLLRDISVLTRMDEAVNMLEMEKVDISALVEKIINEVSIDLDKKQITAVNSIKKNVQIRGNYSLIYSIFRNLMDNSIAYAGTHIQITVNCFREDESLYYFSFADTGVGVGSEHMQRLFERFYRIDKGRSRKLGGTGLGLAIVKNAVLIHGGNISAKSNQGGGLEFIFTLAKDK
ncbi:cell wall metabolism sensor histidine kinase WalK [Bacteroides sp. 51]|uniref:sensor histidine kinase n=1 Tax=Bacteroides sp. 51 TaxID=2302938 RepID=UPI0013D27B21|nr:ATP-binding protein [Bacteroides sp. 51]NDV81516.1 two-component sensor histidine kinase [Bacteroides sp. 51]